MSIILINLSLFYSIEVLKACLDSAVESIHSNLVPIQRAGLKEAVIICMEIGRKKCTADSKYVK